MVEGDTRTNGETAFRVFVNGRPVEARPGDTVAGVLTRGGWRVFRRTTSGAPRGLYCAIGICQECLVVVDGASGRRACMTLVAPGQRIEVPGA